MRLAFFLLLSLAAPACLIDPADYPFPVASGAGDMGGSGGARDMRRPGADAREPAGSPDMKTPSAPACADGSCDCDAAGKCRCDRDCELDCAGQACALDCRADRCQAVGLGAGSTVRCRGEERSCKPLRCEGDCSVECGGEDTHCAVDCAPGARCELKCKGEDTRCSFTQCEREISCPGKRRVCNGPC